MARHLASSSRHRTDNPRRLRLRDSTRKEDNIYSDVTDSTSIARTIRAAGHRSTPGKPRRLPAARRVRAEPRGSLPRLARPAFASSSGRLPARTCLLSAMSSAIRLSRPAASHRALQHRATKLAASCRSTETRNEHVQPLAGIVAPRPRVDEHLLLHPEVLHLPVLHPRLLHHGCEWHRVGSSAMEAPALALAPPLPPPVLASSGGLGGGVAAAGPDRKLWRRS